MSSQFTSWLSISQALATPAIALLAAAIAWAQWYTARSKLVLDLFNQRMEIYTAVREVVAHVMRDGTATGEDIGQFCIPQDRARFLFGDDVNVYLHKLRKTFADLGLCCSIIQMNQGDAEYQKAVDLNYKLLLHVGNFYDEFGALLKPYMGIDHKRPFSRFTKTTKSARNKKPE